MCLQCRSWTIIKGGKLSLNSMNHNTTVISLFLTSLQIKFESWLPANCCCTVLWSLTLICLSMETVLMMSPPLLHPLPLYLHLQWLLINIFHLQTPQLMLHQVYEWDEGKKLHFKFYFSLYSVCNANWL